MDPDACFSTILDCVAAEQWAEAAHHGEDLREWMMRGGFPPGGGKLRKTSIYALLSWLITHLDRDD